MAKFDPTQIDTNKGPAKEKDFSVPPGVYNVIVENIDFREGNKAPYYNMKLRIRDGECGNRIVWDVVSTSERSLWKLAQFCQSVGFLQAFDTVTDRDMFIRACTGKMASIQTELSKDPNHNARARVSSYLQQPETAEKEDVDELDDIPF